jgi:adenosine deaminase
VAHRRIAIEMCPYANLQIKGFPLDQEASAADPEKRYPLKYYLDSKIPVTVNTDNIGISAASLTDNLLLAARLCPGLTRLDILHLLRNAADAAFGPASLRQDLIETLQRSLPSPD